MNLVRWTNRDGQEWACVAYDHGPMCRRCQIVDDTLAACLENVEMGNMEIVGADEDGQFKLRVTEQGEERVRELITAVVARIWRVRDRGRTRGKERLMPWDAKTGDT